MKNRDQKYKKVVHHIEDCIRSGKLKIGDKAPSVNALRIKFNISRSSIFLAMDELKSRGILEAEPAVGYFVSSDQIKVKEKILLLFNEINSFKEDIYTSFVEEIGSDATVDIMFHNYNRDVFETLLSRCNGKYTCYIVMPGKFQGLEGLLKKMSGKVILADHFHPELLGKFSSVGQDFENDTYEALHSERGELMKYKRIILVQQKEKEPEERYFGIQHFSSESGMLPMFIPTVTDIEIESGDLFLTADDLEMVKLLKYSQKHNLTLGQDFGLITYNDTPIKEILDGGITTITTDFKEMGKTLASLVHEQSIKTIQNNCTLIIRKSI